MVLWYIAIVFTVVIKVIVYTKIYINNYKIYFISGGRRENKIKQMSINTHVDTRWVHNNTMLCIPTEISDH
jgi:hypothetical protein